MIYWRSISLCYYDQAPLILISQSGISRWPKRSPVAYLSPQRREEEEVEENMNDERLALESANYEHFNKHLGEKKNESKPI